MEPLTISLFGGLQVLPPGEQTPLRLARGNQVLLAYLLLHPHPVSRDVLMDQFWMEAPPERARGNLNAALYRLRRQLETGPVQPGSYLLSSRSGEVGFNWESAHWLDSAAFTGQVRPLLRKSPQELTAADVHLLESALTLYRGDLLAGLYEEWALREQEHYRSLYLACLHRLVDYYAGRGAYDQAILYAQEMLHKEPLHEESLRDLMRLYASSGQPNQALARYESYCALSQQELDQPPLPETVALAAAIRAGIGLLPSPAAVDPALDLPQLLAALAAAQHTIAEVQGLLEKISHSVAALHRPGD